MCWSTCCSWAWSPERRAEAPGRWLRIAVNCAYLFAAGPDDTLVFLGHRCEPLIHEALHALAAIRFGGVDVALRIGGNAMHAVELDGLPSPLAEGGQDFQRLPIQNVDAVILAIRQ